MAKLSPEASKFIRRHIKRHKTKLHMEQEQAVAVAFAEAREKGFKVPPGTKSMERTK